MKNGKLLKILGICLLITIVLTWVIPGTTLDQSNALKTGSINPAGLFSIFGSFDILAGYFVQDTILLLIIGALYGVMNKTGAYKALVDKIVSIFKGKEKWFLSISIVLFIVIPSLTNIYFPLIIFVPLFVNVLLGLGFNKVSTILATVGSILIGMSSILSSKLFNQMAGNTAGNANVWIKLGFLVVALVVTVLFALKTSSVTKASKKQSEEVKEELIIVPQKRESENKIKRGSLPLIIILVLVLVLMVLGLVPWTGSFFTNMNTSVTGVKIGSFAIFANLFGAFGAFGTWTYNQIEAVVICATILIGLIYKLKFREFIDGVVEGGRKFVGIAVLVCLINLLVIFTLNSGFLATIMKWLVASGNVALITITSIIGAPFVVDQGYVAQYNMGIIAQIIGTKADANLIALITQLTYGITMLVVPTSTVLIAGLAYLEESYTTWVKYIWKLAAVLIIGAFIAITIATLL